MELDEFKNMWAKTAMQPSAVNYNISSLIYSDSKSPLAELEKRFKAASYMFPLTVLIFCGTFISKGANQSITTWLLFTILFIEFLFALANYLLVKKIQQPAGNIRENLAKRAYLLERRTANYLYIHTGLYVVMAILLELSVHYHFDPAQSWWAGISPVLRVIIYIVFLAGQYFIKRYFQKQQYGQYIERLNQLIKQMEA
jgi:hypothetical protein